MDGWSWIPVASFSFCIFIASWGILTLPFLVIAELMPQKVGHYHITCSSDQFFILFCRFVVLARHSACAFYGYSLL